MVSSGAYKAKREEMYGRFNVHNSVEVIKSVKKKKKTQTDWSNIDPLAKLFRMVVAM